MKKTLIVIIVLLSLHSGCSSSLSAKEAMEQNFEYYNNKNFKAYYEMQSTKLMEETLKLTKMSREDFIHEWKKSWVPAEVIKLEEEKSGTENETIISATVRHPSTLLSPEKTTKTKYKLVKENGDWKIDEVISTEEVACLISFMHLMNIKQAHELIHAPVHFISAFLSNPLQ